MNPLPNYENVPLPSPPMAERSGKKLNSKAMTSLRFKACLCGTERCRQLRKAFKDEEDPLERYMSYGISFASDQKSKGKASKGKVDRQAKTDHKKNIYSRSLQKQIKHDTDYQIAALHFPVELLAYCGGKGKKPTAAFKDSEMDEMIEAGLQEYLPPATQAYECFDFYGKSVFFLPPNVSVQTIDYQEKERRALEVVRSRYGVAEVRAAPDVAEVPSAPGALPAVASAALAARVPPHQVRQVPQNTADLSFVPSIEVAVAAAAHAPQEHVRRAPQDATGVAFALSAAAPTVDVAAHAPSVQWHVRQAPQDFAERVLPYALSTAAPTGAGAHDAPSAQVHQEPPSIPSVAAARSRQETLLDERTDTKVCSAVTVSTPASEADLKVPPRSLSPISQLIQDNYFGFDPQLAPSENRFNLKEPSQLLPSGDGKRLGRFQEILQEWTLEVPTDLTAAQKEDTIKSKQKYAEDAMKELERIRDLLDKNPPPEPDSALPEDWRSHICLLPLAQRQAIQESLEQSNEKIKKGQMELRSSLVVPIANRIGAGYVELYDKLNSFDGNDNRVESDRKRRRDPDNGDGKHHQGGQDDSDSHSNGDGGDDPDNGGDRKRLKLDCSNHHSQPKRQRGGVPSEIELVHRGAQSSLALCLSNGRKESSFSEDSSIETEVGSWANGYAAVTKSDPSEFHGLHVLAETCSSAFDWMGFYSAALLMGFPEDIYPEAFNRSSLERGESNKQVLVLDSANHITMDRVFLVKAGEPNQAYKLTGRASKILNSPGPNTGWIYDAVVLPRVHGNPEGEDNLLFQSPRSTETAELVTIKQLRKKAVKEGGQDCPYREIYLLRKVADDVHVRKLVDALEDEHYLYIVMPRSHRGSLLDDVLNKRYHQTTYSEDELKVLFRNILDILLFLEKHSVYHCALTPEYFEFHGNRLFLTCMGLAVQIPREKHRHGPFNVLPGPLDTLSFQPPEVHSRYLIKNSTSAHLWSASITLYYMLTGRTLFGSPHPTDTGFKLYLSTGSLEAMVDYLKANAKAVSNAPGMQSAFAITRREISPHAMELLSKLMQFRPSDRMSIQAALRVARPWFGSQ